MAKNNNEYLICNKKPAPCLPDKFEEITGLSRGREYFKGATTAHNRKNAGKQVYFLTGSPVSFASDLNGLLLNDWLFNNGSVRYRTRAVAEPNV